MSDLPELDTSDLDRHMGVPMRPGELNDDVSRSDIRRWVQAMHYPNPLHYDERWAAESRFGGLVAPQSFAVATDTSHGCSPAQVGRIPNSHLIFGGDEWWFFGPRIVPGDHLVCHRMPYDYKVTQTSFAGPTCFQRGDTLYINQRGERIAQQRSTAIRYPVREAKEKKLFDEAQDPEWTDAELAELEERKQGFIEQIQQLRHDKRLFAGVSVGDRLAEHVLGPHSLASFTTEWRAFPMTTWGGDEDGPTTVQRPGARLHEGDGRPRGRQAHGADQPRAHRRRLLRPVPWPPPTPLGPARRAWRAATATAHRWAPGCSTTWPRGPASGARSSTPSPSTAIPRSPATPPSSTARWSTPGSRSARASPS